MDIWDRSVPSEASAYNWLGAPRINLGVKRLREGAPLAVDLFSGCGGLSEGLRTAGLQTALAIDIHVPSVDTFRHNHPEATTILGDIKAVTDSMITEALGGARISLVAGGAPCQGFSLCNRKQFDGDARNTLFMEYMRIVRQLRPQFVLFENVQNIRAVADGKFIRLIEEHFEELGYSVASGIVNALDFAVPQKRQRMLFFGILGENQVVPWPVGDHRGRKPLIVRDAIGDLPELESDGAAFEYNQEPERDYQREMRRGATQLFNHVAPKHPQETIDRIAATKPGRPMYDSFKQRIRLSWDAPSPTQVCGGIRPQFQFGHPGQPRGLSIRERCRIQSFPDTYELLGGIVMGRVQTGNAVPPRVAEGFGRAIMSLLTGEHRIELTQLVEQPALAF